MKVVWKVNTNLGERIFDLMMQLENYEIGEEEFVEALTAMPGYPLDRPGLPGEDFVVKVVRNKPMVVVPGRVH